MATPRPRRRQLRLTGRRLRVMRLIGTHGWMASEHIRRFLARNCEHAGGTVSAQATRRLLGRMVQAGYLRRQRLGLFTGQLWAYSATQRALDLVGLELGPGHVDIRSAVHDALVADVHVLLGGDDRVRTARQIASGRERHNLPEGLAIRLAAGRTHLPDLVLTNEHGARVAYEIELRRKSPASLNLILAGYRSARLDRVIYLVPTVERANAIRTAARAIGSIEVQLIRELIPDPSWPRHLKFS